MVFVIQIPYRLGPQQHSKVWWNDNEYRLSAIQWICEFPNIQRMF